MKVLNTNVLENLKNVDENSVYTCDKCDNVIDMVEDCTGCDLNVDVPDPDEICGEKPSC